MLLLYIDNIAIVARSIEKISWFKSKFQQVFKVKNLRKIKKILDIKITCNCKTKTLCLNQFYYLNKILDRLHIFVDKYNFVELSINNYDLLQFAESNNKRINQKDYQHAINNIIYTAIYIRSDIVFAIEYLNQYFVDSTKYYNQTLKTLFWYFCFIVDKELIYNSSKNLYLVTYLNSDYVADKLDRKSILDYVFIIDRELIAWILRKQKSVATSTIEAKYIILLIYIKKSL